MNRVLGRKTYSVLLLLVNVLLLAFTVVLYGQYLTQYQERLREENLTNVANLNQSAATNATAFISSLGIKLDDVQLYALTHQLTHDELLRFLSDGNSSGDREFELIGADYAGYLARRDPNGDFIPVSYQGNSYADLQNIFDESNELGDAVLHFVPEFTDGYTALKYFAIFAHMDMKNENGDMKHYTLMLASKAKDVLAVFNNQNVYEGLSSVLVDAKGNYIVSNKDFKSNNFFQYLYVYNDLSLEQRDAIRAEVAQRGSGELYYRDSMGKDCVFRYAKMQTSDWYCITSVPISAFRSQSMNVSYTLFAIGAVLVMLCVDVLWLRGVNRNTRQIMLREKEASDAKTDFLSRMSHDIRTPLNGIIGMAVLASDEENPPETVEYLENIKASGDFLLGLVNDILDMSRVESGKMKLHLERYSSDEFRKYIMAVIAPLCREKSQTFVVSPPQNKTAVMFDRLRLNQIFFNLLSNAVKYTPEGGDVKFYWDKTELGDNRVAFDFIVSDNGIGMSEEFQKHMFEAFSQEQTSMSSQGAGLGLSIVWNLVTLMGGTIDVQSALGKGTTYRVHLETTLCHDAAPVPTDSARVDLSGKRVLVCEDNNINMKITRGLLSKWGVEVQPAENGRIGLETFIASAPGDYDAILMDIRMPVMDGLETARAIRQLVRPDAKTIPIIAMTANAYDADVQNSLGAGMNAHMAKPIQPDKLRATLVELIVQAQGT